ncbi:MAG: hypothetical protein ABR961_09270 [Thermoanaerobaculaceae bacterium]
MGDLDRSQLLALAVAALTLLVSLTVSSELSVRLLIVELACLTFILCGEMIGKFIGLGITQETPGCFVVAIGWTMQILLLVAVTAVAVVRVVRR